MIDKSLINIAGKIHNGQRLDFQDGLRLLNCRNPLDTGSLAACMALSKYGRGVRFCINRHINYTNICTNRCKFCGFSRKSGEEGGYVLSIEDIVKQARAAQSEGAVDLHIVGGIHPDLAYAYYHEMISRIHHACPGLTIKAFTATEILDLAAKKCDSVEDILKDLVRAGLSMLPGGGAEILDESYFKNNCPEKTGPLEWLSVHKTAHKLGLNSTATMLFRFQESHEDRVRHLLTLRDAQDESIQKGKGRFTCFVPLPYIDIQDNGTPDVLDELKTIALSRLLLDNFQYIKAFWPMLGIKTAQMALHFGANDLDGTVFKYEIVRSQQTNDASHQGLTVDEITHLIEEADRVPEVRFYTRSE